MREAAVRDDPPMLAAQRDAIGRSLARLCKGSLDAVSPPVAEAIRYSLLGEGKRMRGTLFLSAFEAAG